VQRTPFFSSLVNITLVLYFLGLFAVVALTFDIVLDDAREVLEMKLLLKDEATEEAGRAIAETYQDAPFVKEIHYVSKAEALESFEVGEEFAAEALGGINPLPASVNIRLEGEYINEDSILVLGELFVQHPEVQEVDYPINLIQKVDDNRIVIYQVGAVLALLLILIAFFLIVNTVRLAIYSRRLAIRTMQLIGATAGYITAPFLRIGLMQGLVGSVISVALIHLTVFLVSENFLTLDTLLHSLGLKLLYAFLIIFGGALGLFSSYMAVRRFLYKQLDQIA